MVKSRRRASSSGVPKTLSRRMSRSPLSPRAALGVFLLDLARIRAKGRRLNDLRPEEDVRQAEPASDDAAVSKEPLDLLRRGAGGDVEVLGLAPEEQIAYAPSNQEGRVIVPRQPLNHLRGVRIDLLRRDLHFGLGLSRPPGTSKVPARASACAAYSNESGSVPSGSYFCFPRAGVLEARAGAAFATGCGGALCGALATVGVGRAGDGGGGAAAAGRGAGGAGGWGAAAATAGGFFCAGGGGVRSSRTGAGAAATGAGCGCGRSSDGRRLGRGRGGPPPPAWGAGGEAAGAGLGAGAEIGADFAAAATTGTAGRGAGAGAGGSRAGALAGCGGGVVTAMRSGIDEGMVLVGGSWAGAGRCRARRGGGGDCGTDRDRRGDGRSRLHLDRRRLVAGAVGVHPRDHDDRHHRDHGARYGETRVEPAARIFGLVFVVDRLGGKESVVAARELVQRIARGREVVGRHARGLGVRRGGAGGRVGAATSAVSLDRHRGVRRQVDVVAVGGSARRRVGFGDGRGDTRLHSVHFVPDHRPERNAVRSRPRRRDPRSEGSGIVDHGGRRGRQRAGAGQRGRTGHWAGAHPAPGSARGDRHSGR